MGSSTESGPWGASKQSIKYSAGWEGDYVYCNQINTKITIQQTHKYPEMLKEMKDK